MCKYLDFKNAPPLLSLRLLVEASCRPLGSRRLRSPRLPLLGIFDDVRCFYMYVVYSKHFEKLIFDCSLIRVAFVCALFTQCLGLKN